jgi:hypothetical protein
MNQWLVWIVTVLYIGQSVLTLCQGRPALALVWGAYALANIGLIFQN